MGTWASVTARIAGSVSALGKEGRRKMTGGPGLSAVEVGARSERAKWGADRWGRSVGDGKRA